jgi:hypothetical protein
MAERFEVGLQDYLIIVREPNTGFYAIYSKPAEQAQLTLQRRKPTNDLSLLAQARQAANEKARELGWII